MWQRLDIASIREYRGDIAKIMKRLNIILFLYPRQSLTYLGASKSNIMCTSSLTLIHEIPIGYGWIVYIVAVL